MINWFKNIIKIFFIYLHKIKSNLTIDNCFDGFLGGLLAVISLLIYYKIHMSVFIIFVFPLLFSIINELINMWLGEKSFSYSDVAFRCIIPLLLFLVVYLK